MELNGINSNVYTASNYSAGTNAANATDSVAPKTVDDTAAVYEKSDSKATSKSYKVDQTTIDKLKADAEARYAQLASLVEKLLTKQGDTYNHATLGDLMKDVRDGKIAVDPSLVEQAKKDIADDGYWGVEQTADRIVSFAKALTGGDPAKVEEMRKAIEKGYKEAGKLWGDELPEISQKTHARVNEMLDEWAKEASK